MNRNGKGILDNKMIEKMAKKIVSERYKIPLHDIDNRIQQHINVRTDYKMLLKMGYQLSEFYNQKVEFWDLMTFKTD